MKLILIILFVGLVLFIFSGIKMIANYRENNKHSLRIGLKNTQEVSIQSTGKYYVHFHKKTTLESEHAQYKRGLDLSLEFISEAGERLSPKFFTSVTGNNMSSSFVSVGFIKLEKGNYILNIGGPESYFNENYFLIASKAGVFLLIAGIFCIVFPLVAFILGLVANLSA